MPKFDKSLQWDDLKLIKTIADAGNISAASGLLGLNISTVYRKLLHVEEALGFFVFERKRSKYIATFQGEAIIELAGRIDQDIDSLARDLSSLDPHIRGSLDVATNDAVLAFLVAPVLPRFKEHFPDISVTVHVGNQSLSLNRSDADIAIRCTNRPPQNLIGRRICRPAWGLYGTETYAIAIEAGQRLEELDWISLGGDLSGLPAAVEGSRNVRGKVQFSVNSVMALASLVAQGIGVAYLPCFVGDNIPQLKSIGDALPDLGHDLWVLFHPESKRSPAVRAFTAFIARELSQLDGPGEEIGAACAISPEVV